MSASSSSSKRRFRWTSASDSALELSEQRLLRSHPDITSHRVPINNGRDHIHILLSGASNLQSVATDAATNAPIVLIAGFGAGAAMWWKNHSAIAARTQRPVLAVDLLGCGRSSRPEFPRNSPLEAEDFFLNSLSAALFDELRLDRVVLVGHSLGGFLSAAFAMRHRARVEKLVLVSPVGIPRRPDDYAEQTRNSRLFRTIFSLWERGWTPQRLVRLAGPRGERLVRAAVTRRFWTIESPEERDALSDYVYQISAHPASGEHAMNTILQPGAFARRPLVDRIDQLDDKLDTLFIYGEQDWMDPTLPIEWVTDTRRAHNWQLRFIPNAGHQLFIEQPEHFNAIASDFIDGTLERRQVVRRRVRRSHAPATDDFEKVPN
jgi:cardiolipin-specific phospholipase